jgi:hypothetical protein
MGRWLVLTGWVITVVGCSGGSDVQDGDGGPQSDVPWFDADAPVAAVQGRVFEAETATALAGATVKARVGDQEVETTADAQGRFELLVPESDTVVITAELAAHAKTVEVTSTHLASASYVETFLPMMGATGQIDASAQSKFEGPLGSSIELPAGGLVDAAGAPVTGTVDVSLTPINPRSTGGLRAVPGLPVLRWADGREATAEIKAPMTITLRKDGQEVNLAPGATAKVDIPVFDALGPAQMVLYGLDEATGKWAEDGAVYKAQTAHGPVYKAVVSHLSSWAGGRTVERTCLRGCVVREGAPVPGARVRLTGVDFDFRGSATVRADGCFAVDTKAGGQVRLAASDATGASDPVVVVAPAALMEAGDDPAACEDVGTLALAPADDPEDPCPRGFAQCGGRCVDLDADPAHCGGCDQGCSDPLDGVLYDRCVGGACACAASHQVCDMACTDTTSDNQNCGGCGATCEATQECSGGTCQDVVCDEGLASCEGEGAPVCVDLNADALHCGECHEACPVGADCSAGSCTQEPTDGGVSMPDGGSTDPLDAGSTYDAGSWDAGGGDPMDAGYTYDAGWWDSGGEDPMDAGYTYDAGSWDSGGAEPSDPEPDADAGSWEEDGGGGTSPVPGDDAGWLD